MVCGRFQRDSVPEIRFRLGIHLGLKTPLFNFLGNMGYMSVKDRTSPGLGVVRGKELNKLNLCLVGRF